jgi:hypothetical protein
MASSFVPREVVLEAISRKNTEAAASILKGMAVKNDPALDDGALKCSATDDKAIGIARYDAAPGEWFAVLTRGVAVALAGGGITRGDRIGPDAASKTALIATDKKTVLGVAQRSAVLDELYELQLGSGVLLSI